MSAVRVLGDVAGVIYDRLYQVGRQLSHSFAPDPSERYRGGSRAPVLLLPGVYETWEFLRPLADALHDRGHPIHTLPELGYNRRLIADSAELGNRYLRSRDLSGVILLAHSKGGIIGKRMMVTDDAPARISRLIAICSPFAGSTLARFAPNPALRAFHPHNALLRELAELRETNARIVSLYSRLDPLIPGGSRLEGATNIELPMVGHFRPLSSVRVLDEVLRATRPEVEE